MTDPFSNGAMGGPSLDPIATTHSVNHVQRQRERAISAYRHNIAVPGVYIADRSQPIEDIKAVGDDGEELTPERRAQLMKEAGVKPMFADEAGEELNEQDCTNAFDEVIEQERMGETADAAVQAQGMRIVQPREFEIDLDGELDDTTVASAGGATYLYNVDPEADTERIERSDDDRNPE